MMRSLGFALATMAVAVAVILPSSPASAQRAVADDPAGDASGHGLDITQVAVRNLDHAVITKVTFVESRRGDLIVSIDPRGGRGVRLISEYDPVGHTNNLVVAQAFSNHQGRVQTIACPGFRVRWSADEPTATLRLPSSCLNGGDYGAIRFAVLTEGGRSGSDSDYAPEAGHGDVGSSSWVARG